MTGAFCVLLMSLGLFRASGQSQSGSPATEGKWFDESKSLHDLKLEITQVLPDGKITVQVRNISKVPVRIWREDNEWGAGHWRVLRLRKGQVETFFEQLTTPLTANSPLYTSIPRGAHIEELLDLNWSRPSLVTWRGLRGSKVTFEPGDTVIVVYEVPATLDAIDLSVRGFRRQMSGQGVWYGVAAACAKIP
jgi:hypothetical protein